MEKKATIQTPIDKKNYNFIVSLEDTSNLRKICAGIFISFKHVLTSASCLHQRDLGQIRVMDIFRYKHDIEWFHPHPLFGTVGEPEVWTDANDVGVIALMKNASFSPDMGIARLDLTGNHDSPRTGTYFGGWGSNGSYYDLTKGEEYQTSIPVRTDARVIPCNAPGLICATSMFDHQASPCLADKGGPLAYQLLTTDPIIVIGILSNLNQKYCTYPRTFARYVKISAQKGFIKEFL